jgi:hypothetical protein
MRIDMLDHLRLDRGTRIVGQLFQDREWEADEITRLWIEISRMVSCNEVRRVSDKCKVTTELFPTHSRVRTGLPDNHLSSREKCS